MNKIHCLSAAALLSACTTTAHSTASNTQAQAQFERLKKLEGNWITVSEKAGSAEGIKAHYHTTAGGSAVVETLVPARDEEMVSVYHLDRGALVMTHYCSLGNHPHMRAAAPAADGTITFTCDGSSNVSESAEMHMHSVEFKFTDDSHVRATWTLYDKGHSAEVAPFAFVRSW